MTKAELLQKSQESLELGQAFLTSVLALRKLSREDADVINAAFDDQDEDFIQLSKDFHQLMKELNNYSS